MEQRSVGFLGFIRLGFGILVLVLQWKAPSSLPRSMDATGNALGRLPTGLDVCFWEPLRPQIHWAKSHMGWCFRGKWFAKKALKSGNLQSLKFGKLHFLYLEPYAQPMVMENGPWGAGQCGSRVRQRFKFGFLVHRRLRVSHGLGLLKSSFKTSRHRGVA